MYLKRINYQMASIENNLDVSFGIFGKGQKYSSWATLELTKIIFIIVDLNVHKKNTIFFTRHISTEPSIIWALELILAKIVENIFKDFFYSFNIIW